MLFGNRDAFNPPQDSLLLVGPPGSGKTTWKTQLYQQILPFLLEYKMPYTMITARTFMEEQHILDHEQSGGINHITPGSPPTEWGQSHTHSGDIRKEKFYFINQQYVENGSKNFFRYITALPHDGTFYIIEWPGGVKQDSRIPIDMSYETIGKLITGDCDFTSRIRFVLHPVTTEDTRELFNEQRKHNDPAQIEKGFASIYKTSDIMQTMKYDDFYMIENKFRHVFNIENDGQANYAHFKELTIAMLTLLSPLRLAQKLRNNKELASSVLQQIALELLPYTLIASSVKDLLPAHNPFIYPSPKGVAQYRHPYVLEESLLEPPVTYQEYKQIHDILPEEEYYPYEIALACERIGKAIPEVLQNMVGLSQERQIKHSRSKEY